MRKKKYKKEEDFGYEDLIAETLTNEDNNSFDDDDDDRFSFETPEIEPQEDPEEEEEEVEVVEETEQEKKLKKKSQKQKFYVDPKEFDKEIMDYYTSGNISNLLAEMISKISHKLSYASNFINYSYREEMVGDGIVRMMKALLAKKYDREKASNPFSYFTKIAFNAFRNRIKKEKHIHETHEKYQEQLNLLSSNYNLITKNKNTKINKIDR
jgi:hypothetical protein